jgi:hypothetical protein
MKTSILGALVPTTMVVLRVGMLGGCAPATVPTHTGSSSHTIAPSASPTPTSAPDGSSAALGPLLANTLFRITATATASDGAVADLVETGVRAQRPGKSSTRTHSL